MADDPRFNYAPENLIRLDTFTGDGELAAKRPALEDEYRRLWTENNRPGGVDDSVRQLLYGETHN